MRPRCSVDLNWNLYSNWNGGIDYQEIWISVNGAPPVLEATLNASVTFYSYRNVNDGDSYCFFIQAKESGTSELSQSNEACTLPTAFAQPINELFLVGLSVGADNTVNVEWGVNDNAYIKELEIFRASNQANFETAVIELPEARFPAINQTLDENVNAGNNSYTYQLMVVDSCGNEVLTAQGATIHLKGNSSGVNTSQLDWTPLIIESAQIERYKIMRIANGTDEEVGSVIGSSFSYEDIFDEAAVGDGTICYYVVAVGQVISPSGSFVNFACRSNIICIRQPITIHAPNALAPNGFNQEFKPLILSGTIARYEMQIFDRYGSMVYSADSPDEGWKGKKDGKKLPQGVYVYRIALVLENGDSAEKKGNVLLLR